ncbi:MAG TPA: hypothetical protein VN578_12300 [Candidatus Binatia bacterium]|jgi:hypothetical protein|nr:hypothetical protein [Candidatus Binatia bacterium]
MRIFLRNKITGSYFQGVEDWTARLDEAFNFPSPERAAKFVVAVRLNVNDMEVVFAFDNPDYNIPLPIDERFGVLPVDSERPGAKPVPLWPGGAPTPHVYSPWLAA